MCIEIIFKDPPANVQNIHDSENKIDPWVHLCLLQGYIHLYDHTWRASILVYIPDLRGAFTGQLVLSVVLNV